MEFEKISKIMRHIERSTPEKVLQLRTILSNDNIEYENQADNLQEWIQNAPEKIIESLQKLYRISKEKEIKQEIIKKHTNENIEKIFSILNEEEEKEIAKIMKRKSLKMPKKVKLREETLYRNIMKINNINSINKNQKIWLTDRYLTYQYLNRIPYGNYNTIKNQINYDIQNIKRIEKDEKPKSAKSMSLKQAYDLYKKVIKFQEGIDKMSKGDFTDEDSIKTLITSVSFIFNMSKNKSQYEKNSFKAMQYAFWQTVIETGGKYAEFPISADFLQHSLEKKNRKFSNSRWKSCTGNNK